jgi:PAS domain S-box-containing protein
MEEIGRKIYEALHRCYKKEKALEVIMMDEVRQQKLAEIIFENIQDGIIMLDRNYRILALNKSVEKWTGRPLSDLMDKDSRDVFHDHNGICPHCAAELTFETGNANIVAQRGNLKGNKYYAELLAYPVKNEKGEVIECVVFIQNITERTLCHEEVFGLYNEVTQTKEYLEGFVENSADAIVTSDLNGIVTSWNKGAERTYGFTKEDVLGKFLPFVPDFLIDPESEMVQKIKDGEVLKDIETFRKKKDGTIITVSLTLSPIKNTAGEVIGTSSISRDISEKKRVEKELVRRNQELSRLFFISSAMRGTLELDRLLRMVLTAVTMSDGLGFNRAILFLVDQKKNVLKGAMGVGPSSPTEAGQIWERLSLEKKTLSDIMREVETGPLRKDSFFDRLSQGMEIGLDGETILTKAVKDKRLFNVEDVKKEPLSDAVLTQQLGTYAYAVVPLISRDKVRGVLWVDNYFNRKPVVEEDMRFLTAFSNHVATAIESARLYEQVALAEQELENIFESISDMVYFITKDYVIKSINKAVSKRLGKPPEEIIGKKCYEIFHGMNEPWEECPHKKTVDTKKPYVEEVGDPYLGGTFITSSSPIFDTTGEFIGTVHILRDITELKSLQERLVMTEKMAALGEVAAKVAHEIRNPLVSVGGFARRLEKKLEGSLKEYADIIAKEVERLEVILSEILGFVKEIRIVKEVVDFNKLIEEVISLIKSQIDERGITLIREIGEPTKVYVDPGRIKEALLNILSNAVQSIGDNGTIFIKTYVKDNNAVVEIRDTGEGIAEESLPFIFDPFFTTKKTGTGLGLTITHRIIEEHKGSIEVESKPGQGSTFRVFIPLNIAMNEK